MTKQLASLNEKNIALGDKSKFQLVLVGYDNSKEGSQAYLKASKLGSVAVKFDEKKGLSALLKKGDTGFLPNVVQLKADGTMVSNDRATVLKNLAELVE